MTAENEVYRPTCAKWRQLGSRLYSCGRWTPGLLRMKCTGLHVLSGDNYPVSCYRKSSSMVIYVNYSQASNDIRMLMVRSQFNIMCITFTLLRCECLDGQMDNIQMSSAIGKKY